MLMFKKKVPVRVEDRTDISARMTRIAKDALPNKGNRITAQIGLPPIRGKASPRLFY